MSTLKPESNGPLYNNTAIGTLAVDEWTVAFGTARRGLGGLRPRPVPSSLYQMQQLTHQRPVYQLHIIMPPPVGKGAVSVAFVRPFVTYIASNSRTQKPSVPKFRTKIPHLWCVSHTSFKVKRSKVTVISGPLIVTHIVRHIFQTARPTNFKLGTRMEEDDPHQPQAPWPPRSKVKVARSLDQS